jgi:hypothetical protein
VADSNAIGDFYTCAKLLKDSSDRSKLLDTIRAYGRLRLEMDRGCVPQDELDGALQKCFDLQDGMTVHVAAVLKEGMPIAVPLTNTLTNGPSTSRGAIL